MPVTIVVGGQFGSEGKGKVTHWLAHEQRAQYAVRVGGPNSGHTVVENGRTVVLRQLPTPVLNDGVIAVVPAGAYVDTDILLREVEEVGLRNDQLLIHPSAVVLDDSMRAEEGEAGLVERIASTGQGIGGAVAQRAMRRSSVTFASTSKRLREFVHTELERNLALALDAGERIIVEGTQGFGLSILHGGNYPYLTSRDTTAAGALSEAGLSPRNVDCVALVLRSFPIRVGGNSGPLPQETTWQEIARQAGATIDLTEFTTVTGRVRRVAEFHQEIALRAIRTNRPDILFLNHADYFDYAIHEKPRLSRHAGKCVTDLEYILGLRIDYVGSGPSSIIRRPIAGWIREMNIGQTSDPRALA